MNFREVLDYCLKSDDLVREWNRLSGHKLLVKRSPIEAAIDNACGYDQDKEAMPQFVDFVFEYIWLPVAIKVSNTCNG